MYEVSPLMSSNDLSADQSIIKKESLAKDPSLTQQTQRSYNRNNNQFEYFNILIYLQIKNKFGILKGFNKEINQILNEYDIYDKKQQNEFEKQFLQNLKSILKEITQQQHIEECGSLNNVESKYILFTLRQLLTQSYDLFQPKEIFQLKKLDHQFDFVFQFPMLSNEKEQIDEDFYLYLQQQQNLILVKCTLQNHTVRSCDIDELLFFISSFNSQYKFPCFKLNKEQIVVQYPILNFESNLIYLLLQAIDICVVLLLTVLDHLQYIASGNKSSNEIMKQFQLQITKLNEMIDDISENWRQEIFSQTETNQILNNQFEQII